MDKAVLVSKLRAAFEAINRSGFHIDCASIIPAYPDLVSSSFVLLVSAPSLTDKSRFEKIDLVVQQLYTYLDKNTLREIDRVQIYNSKEAIEIQARADFGDSFVDYCSTVLCEPAEQVA